MEESLITPETAKLAKEKGFNIAVWDYFKIITISAKIIEDCVPNRQNFNNISDTIFNRPTQSLLQKWLREVHNIHINMKSYDIIINNKSESFYIVHVQHFKEEYKSYEEALEIGLQEALKLIK